MTVIVGIDEGKVLLAQEGTGFAEGAPGDLRALTQTPVDGRRFAILVSKKQSSIYPNRMSKVTAWGKSPIEMVDVLMMRKTGLKSLEVRSIRFRSAFLAAARLSDL